MRTTFLMLGTALVVGCAVESNESIVEGEDDDLGTASQGIKLDPTHPRGGEIVFDEWSDIEAVETQNPRLYQQSLDLLVDVGVGCSNLDGSSGRCLVVDEQAAETKLNDNVMTCTEDCDWVMPEAAYYCVVTCCMTIVYRVCSSETYRRLSYQ